MGTASENELKSIIDDLSKLIDRLSSYSEKWENLDFSISRLDKVKSDLTYTWWGDPYEENSY